MRYKWTLFTFSRGDFKSVERYLNEQAAKGWELERTGIFARWKRTERTDLTWCVDLAKPKQDREDRIDYVEFCREGGWELAAVTNQMYIFKSLPGMDAVPIHTDPELEKKQYNKYYIRNTILSVLVLGLYFGFLLTLAVSLGGWGQVLDGLKDQWMHSWITAGILPALPIWGVWAVWKIIDFARAVVKGRTGAIGESPRWVMWLNNVLAFAAGIGAVLFFTGDLLDLLFAEELNLTILILLLIWGGTLLYRALAMEKELFPRERRRHIVTGAAMLVLFAALIAGRALAPYGEWTTGWFSWDEEQAMDAYDSSYNAPLVHTEDVGLSFDFLDGGYVDVEHQLMPVGEWWSLGYSYPDGMTGDGLFGLSSVSVRCFGRGQAEHMAEALANGMGVDRRYAVWPESGLEPVELDWADEAWCAQLTPDGVAVSFLVVRMDDVAARLIFPTDLMTEENLTAIKAELEK